MRKIIISIIAVMLVIPFAAGCAGIGYACDTTVTGTLRMVGSEPMTELILETKDKETYAIIGDKKQELSAKQGYNVTVTGKLTKPTGIAAKKAINVDNYKVNNQ